MKRKLIGYAKIDEVVEVGVGVGPGGGGVMAWPFRALALSITHASCLSYVSSSAPPTCGADLESVASAKRTENRKDDSKPLNR